MNTGKLTAYKGHDPYIFISYAHADSKRVMPIIGRLQEDGYRVWYDEGIEVGTKWAEYIAQYLQKSCCMIAFITKNYLSSENCIDEIEYSKNEKIPSLLIYLEDLQQPEWMKLRHGRTQAIFCSQYKTDSTLFARVYETEIIKPCRSGNAVSSRPRQSGVYHGVTSRYHIPEDPFFPLWFTVYHYYDKLSHYMEKSGEIKYDEEWKRRFVLEHAQKFSAQPITQKDILDAQAKAWDVKEGRKGIFIRKKLDTVELQGKTIDIYDVISSELVMDFSGMNLMNGSFGNQDFHGNYLYGTVRKSYREQPEIIFLKEYADGSLKLVEDPVEFTYILGAYLNIRFLGSVPPALLETSLFIQDISIKGSRTVLNNMAEGIAENLPNTKLKKFSRLMAEASNMSRIGCQSISGWNPGDLLHKKRPIAIEISKRQIFVMEEKSGDSQFKDLYPLRDDRFHKTVTSPLQTVFRYPRIKNPLLGYTVLDIAKSPFIENSYFLFAYPQKNHCVDKLRKEPTYFVVEKNNREELSVRQYIPSESAAGNLELQYLYERFALIAAQTDYFCSWAFDDTRVKG